MRPRTLLAGAVLALALGLLRINISPSLPRGLYGRLPKRPLGRDALVALCLPPGAAALYREHARAPTGSCPDRLPPFLKVVAASGGDLVTFGPEGLRTAGGLFPSSAPLPADSSGRPLPHAPYGIYRLSRGAIWLYAPQALSFDSRYFGPLPESSVLYRLLPLWTVDPTPLFCHLPPFSSRLLWRKAHV
jgi:conjugative transfer signal peptidase TraF